MKRARAMLFTLVVLFCASPVAAQDITAGQAWRKMEPDAKVAYILGASVAADLAMMFLDTEVEQKTISRNPLRGGGFELLQIPQSVTGEIVRAVDGFYGDPANTCVAPIFAITYARLRMSGLTESELAERIAGLRRLSDCPR